MKSFILILLCLFSTTLNAQSFLVEPSNDWVQLSTNAVSFSWNGSTDCSNYEMNFSSDPSFDIFNSFTITGTDTSIQMNTDVYFWRIKGITNSGDVLWTSETRTFGTIDLNSLGTIQFWFIPDVGLNIEGVDEVSSWVSNSSNSYAISQANEIKRPKRIPNVIGSHPGVSFDGINGAFGDQLDGSSVSVGTIFSVFRHQNSIQGIHSGRTTISGGNPRHILILGPPSGNFIHTYSSAFVNFRINFQETNQSPPNTWLLVSSVRSQTLEMASYSISPEYGGYKKLKGTIMENIAFAEPLTTGNQLLVEDYLRCKYAPPVSLGKDIQVPYGFCDTILQTNEAYENYLWSSGETSPNLTVSESGTYWVECTNIFGQTSRDSISVSFPNFSPPENTVFCPNETVLWNPIDGNGYEFLWSDGSVSQNNNIGIVGSYNVTILDTNGCDLTTDTFLFTEDLFPSTVLLGNDTSLCSGNEITFINGYDEAETFIWSTLENTQSITINSSGAYSIEATNENQCTGSDTIEVSVIGTAPTLVFSLEDQICQGSELSFSENSTVPPGNTINQVIWDFGEIDSLFVSNGTQVYIDSGLYVGFLQVSTAEGCSTVEEFNVTVHPKPIITFSTENYCPNEEITFTASNSYDVPLESYLWDLGQDSNTSVDSNPNYSYGLTGNFEVELISIDTNSCVDTVLQNVYVQPAPIADISILNPCEYSVWNLTDNSSIADTFEITSYNWDYGDGTDSINPIQGKFYESYGDYEVQLILTADNGCVDTSSQNLTVHPNPIINFEVGPACKNTWTQFENTSSIPFGDLTASNWLVNLQFSDDEINTAFKFTTTGIQLIALQSTSDKGCVIDSTFTIDVQNELIASFEVDPATLISDIPIVFKNLSIGADSSFWDFGDGNGFNYNNQNENTVTYPSQLNGADVDVVLMTTNVIGCRDTAKTKLGVNEAFCDLNLKTIFIDEIEDYLTIGVEIENLGSLPLEQVYFVLQTPENGPIMESWSGSILQNQSEIYVFNAHPSSYISLQDQSERFVCIKGTPTVSMGYEEIDLNNNLLCKNIEGTGIVLLPLYPNPTDKNIEISILITESSPLQIEVINEQGQLLFQRNQATILESGIHRFNIPFSEYSRGIYYIKIGAKNTVILEKVIRF